METDMTREEAIEIIKRNCIPGRPLREACEMLIPELAESEDEKIRKEIISFIRAFWVDHRYSVPQTSKWLDWLEQKKTPSVSFEPAAGFDSGSAVVYHNDESEDERIRKYIVNFVELNKGTNLSPDDADRMLVYLEKQKEQTEELSTRMNGLMQEYVKSGKDEEEQEHRLKCYHLFWDALGDSEFFKHKEQKSEWSDEDEKMLLSIISSFRNGIVSTIGQEQWLKFLPERFNLEPKQEWNDEDELMRTAVIQTLETFGGRGTTGMQIDWMKSLPEKIQLSKK